MYTKIEEVLLLLLWVLKGLYLLSIVKIHLPFCFRNWKYAPVLKYNSYMQFNLKIKYINILIMDTKGNYPILSFGLEVVWNKRYKGYIAHLRNIRYK